MNIPHLQEQISLAQFTTFKIGGPARWFITVSTAAELAHAIEEAHKNNVPVFILGGGSDILVSDDGFDGLVIKMELREVEFDIEKEQVRAGAGLLMSGLIGKTLKESLSGLEYAIGVPATVGGAVWANLGARGHDIAEFLIECTIVDENGKVRTLTNEECEFSYRESVLKHKKWTVVDALFQLKRVPKEEMKESVKQLSALRNDTQDITALCAGCIFRNPTDQTDEAAAKLIDELGLKGKTIGGATVSEKHANFIINTGNATAQDVIMLISYIKQQVRDKKGVQLMEEVEYIGFD